MNKVKPSPTTPRSLISNPKGLKTVFIIAFVAVTLLVLWTLAYWIPQLVRSSTLVSQNNYTTGTFVEKSYHFIPQFGKFSGVDQSVVSYEVNGKELTAESFIWSTRPGRTSTVFYDAKNPTNAVTETHLKEAQIQVGMATFVLLLALGLGLYTKLRKNRS